MNRPRRSGRRSVTHHEILNGLADGVPPIRGYVLTEVKENPLVEVILRSPLPATQKNATVLAAWHFGAGRAVALTTDAGRRWATDWTGWEGYNKLFSQIVRWAMRPVDDAGHFWIATSVEDGRTEVIVTAMDDDGRLLNGLNLSGSVVTPGDSRGGGAGEVLLRMEQVAPGRYIGRFDSEEPGSYMIAVSPGVGTAPIVAGVSVPYSREYRAATTNAALLTSLAGLSPARGAPGVYVSEGLRGLIRGEARTDRHNPFRDDLPPAVFSRGVWPWVVLAGCVLFWGDVFVRRVQLQTEWLGKIFTSLTGRTEPAPAPETMSRLKTSP